MEMVRFLSQVGKWVLAVLPVALLISFAYLFIDTRREYLHFVAREAEMAGRLEAKESEFVRKRAYLEKLSHDPEFLEAVVRERLGFARPGEVIFRFVEE
ncbi:MAG: septum formation initiator family protein [Puniceicoccaceae bacterium]